MKRFSSFCMALSAAVLLTAGSPEPAQSSTGHREGAVVSVYSQDAVKVARDVRQNLGIASVNVMASVTLKNSKRRLNLTITPNVRMDDGTIVAGDLVFIKNVIVAEDGSYSKTLGDGRRISGQLTDLTGTVFTGASGHFRNANGLRVNYDIDLQGQQQTQSLVIPGGLGWGRLANAGRYIQRNVQVQGEGLGFTSGRVAGLLDLSRPTSEELKLRRYLTLVINPTGSSGQQATILFPDMIVRPDGSFRKRNREDGYLVEGRIETDLISSVFDPSLNSISGTYTARDGTTITWETDEFRRKVNNQNDTRPSLLSYLMHHESWDYTNGFGTLIYHVGDPDVPGHLARGQALQNDVSAGFSADPRVYTDKPSDPSVTDEARNVSCQGMNCTASVGNARNLPILTAGDFLAHDDAGNARTVTVHQDISYTLDRSGDDAIGSHWSFGAWMDHAGFFLATDGSIEVRGRDRDARMVVALGEAAGSRPDANATWRGAMVGTGKQQGTRAKNHLLRGDVELNFDMSRSTLNARFFNIRDFSRFAVPYNFSQVSQEVEGRRNRLSFQHIPVAADGSYALTYDGEHPGDIRGRLYGSDHEETAGTFDRYNVIAAFGAKKVDRDAPPATIAQVFIDDGTTNTWLPDGRIFENGEDTGRRWR